MCDIWKPCVTPLSGDQLGGRKGNQFSGGGEQNRKERIRNKRKKRKRKKRKKRKRKERKRRRKGGGPAALPPFFGVWQTEE